jgi:hypothetical protein
MPAEWRASLSLGRTKDDEGERRMMLKSGPREPGPVPPEPGKTDPIPPEMPTDDPAPEDMPTPTPHPTGPPAPVA